MSSNYSSNSFIFQSSKIPISTKRSKSKTKPSSSSSIHSHIPSNSSPLCILCGSIFTPSQTTSLKPKNLHYSPELSHKQTFSYLQHEIQTQSLPQPSSTLQKNLLSLRKTIISKIFRFKNNFKMTRESLYSGIILMDTLLLKENPNTYHKIEQIGIACYFISMKYHELIISTPLINDLLITFELNSSYSCEYIRKLEVNVIKKLNYKLNYVSFYNVVQFFLMNGIVFNSDKITNNNYTSVYFLTHQICDSLLENGLSYLKYNQLYLGCAIIALSRKIKDNEKWPSIFEELYHITENDFIKEYDFVNGVYLPKTQMVKLPFTHKKITRNSSYNTNNNLYKKKHKCIFNSNYSNSNANSHNSQLLKKIFSNIKIISKSMEMTSTARNISSNSNKKNVTILRKTSSYENLRERKCLSNNMKHYCRIDSASSNRSHKIRICSVKKENFYHNHRLSSSIDKYSHNNNVNNIKEHFSINSSYCSATDTLNGNNVEKINVKKIKMNNSHKNINDYQSKITNSSSKGKSKKQCINIPYRLNVSQSFYKIVNNENKSGNDVNNCQINKDKQYINNKKEMMKRKIEDIEEMTMNMLSRISNKARYYAKKQVSCSKLERINKKYKGLNERKIRKLREIMLSKKKIIKNNDM